MKKETALRVDIDQVLRDKNPALARWLSSFLVRYLKRIVHQDEINYVLEHYGNLPPIEFVQATLAYMQVTYEAVGVERLSKKKRYLFASNHPFGGLDGMMLVEELTRHFGQTKLIVNDILMNLTPIAPLFIPINKHGRQSAQTFHTFKEELASTIQIGTFPAGLCSRKIKGKVRDLPWKPSFVKQAIETHRDIVPVYFEGELSRFFYNFARIRTGLGVKANLEMLYLVDEMFRQRGRHFRIYFADPIPWQHLTAKHSPATWAKMICKKVYALKKEVDK